MNSSNFILILLLVSTSLFAQKKILVYHETNGFRHTGAINNGITMFEDLGTANGAWTADNSQDSSVFNATNLNQYDAVVFLNTSGNNLLTTSEKEAFENFIKSGKGFVGIHAATDTYRNRSWDFYNELVGGIVQTSPNHTANNFNANIEVKTDHPLVSFLSNMPPVIGSIWNKNEEYYYWEQNGGQLSTDNIVLLEVESTGSQSYDAARPITWYKESIAYDDDGNSSSPKITAPNIKSFYTALGHNGSDYSSDSNFRELLENAVLWAIGNTLSIKIPKDDRSFIVFPNPVSSKLMIKPNDIQVKETTISIHNVTGSVVYSYKLSPKYNLSTIEVDISDLSSGFYLLRITEDGASESYKILKK